jgi:hypothetical protein
MPPIVVLPQLPHPVRELIGVNQTLYSGNWQDLIEDLRRRQAGRPYLFKYTIDLDNILAWAQRLHQYEAARGDHFPQALPA